MAKRRNRADVLRVAFELLEEGGLGMVTLNGIARRLGAHLNSVSFQVKTKRRLLDLMAAEVLGHLSLDDLPTDPIERIEALLERYRTVLLAHRDGARLVAGTEAVERNTLRVADASITALLEAGADPLRAVRTFWSLHFFLLGLVQEEQERSPITSDSFARRVDDQEYPALATVGRQLIDDPFDERFAHGLRSLLSSIAEQ
ncbi:TetR/AcrR family transcriptional regulator C-terminal domain-containing protein [Brevibacterium aurantiacum]|uniref:TetR/AcrR family transcriptional regulator C-terminal domain-containing protein n=1 Tax=Brevibacterium aurantiacum TaxID=273384 RepID=UPI001C906AEF|nr:TetR/AcrR family transcriptional regulator C-terminal domain-containing protein [Brevibacterium aurantiacum]